jgi:hypothetical protein
MSYTINQPPGESYFIVTLHEDYTMDDFGPATAEAMTVLDNATRPLTYILDTSRAHFSFEAVAESASRASRVDNPPFKHPNINGIVFVTGDDHMMTLAVQGLDSEVFGYIKCMVCASVDEAITYAKQLQ